MSDRDEKRRWIVQRYDETNKVWAIVMPPKSTDRPGDRAANVEHTGESEEGVLRALLSTEGQRFRVTPVALGTEIDVVRPVRPGLEFHPVKATA